MKRWTVAALMLVLGLTLGIALNGPFSHGQVAPNTAPPRELVSYRDVVKTVLPAVVSIESKSKVVKTKSKPRGQAPLDQGQIPEEFRRFFEDFGRMPERFPDTDQGPRLGFGSGFFIDARGIILTNFHVVDGAEVVTVQLADGRKFTSRDIKGDRRTDLAIVTLDAKGPFPTLAFADSEAMEIGDRVLAVGAPFGLTGSVTHGIVSAKGRNGLSMNMYEDFVQTDAAINPGNSGGPLVNLDGNVIGINSAIKSRSGGFQGVGLAIASNLAKRVTKALVSDGAVHRGYLGVQIRDLDPEVASRLNLPKNAGVVVAQVFDNTPASKAGLQPGDVVTSIAGKPVKDGKGLQGIVADLPKQQVEVKLVRDNQPMTLQVNVEEQPSEFGTASVPAPRQPQASAGSVGIEAAGIDVADLTETMADDLGYRKGTRGVAITRVDSGSVASDAGLRKGMLIVKVDGKKVTSAAQVQEALQTASLNRGVLLQVESPQGGVNFVLLKRSSGA